jgi:YVTN family beta-propeller protein
MSQIIFGGTVSMLTVATPSTGWIVGYDDDGVLKQKDIFGIITEIGGGLTNPNDLQTVLSLGNDSGVNSIIMGTSTYIKSNNGGGKIELDYGGVTNSILISTDNSTSNEHGLILQNGFVALFSNGYNQAIELENGNGDLAIYNINGSGSVLLGVATGSGVPYTEIDEIKISYNTTSTQSTGDYDKQSVFIGTRNSQIGAGVVNTVVIGGQSITATQSDSVYVPNVVIQDGKSIRSSNTIFTLNDSGKTLLDRNGGSYDQSWLQFSQDSNYREFIELGVNTDLGYGSQSGIILRATSGPSYSWQTYSLISVDKSNIVLESNDLDMTLKTIKLDISAENNNATIYGSSSFRGLEYNDDFSASYSVRSLVDKQYVDTQVLSVSAPNIYTVLNAGNDTDTKSIIMGTGTNIRSGNPSSGGQINLDFGVGNRVLISTDNGGLSTAYVELAGSNIEITSSQFYLEANNGQLEIGNNEGLKYTAQQTNLQNRSLVDKEYVDLGTASIWNNLETTAYSPTSSQGNYFPFYTSARNLSTTSSIYSSLSKTKGTINGTVSVGTLPKNIFYEPVSKRMIVVNETSNNITVINSLTKSVVGTVSVGTQPHGIAFNPNTNDIFISNKGSNNISKFNLNTLVISATISVGTFPEGIQYLNNKLYVANRVSNNISVVDTTTNLISATISTSTPKEFTYDSKNNKLWFIGVGPDYVGIIDPTTNTIINSIQVGSNPFNLEYDSNNDRIWVSNNGSTNISVIDTSNNLISATISLGSAPSIIKNNPVDNYMYVSDYSGSQFFEIDTNSLTVTNTVSVGGFSGGLSYNDYTGELYYSQSNLNKVLAYQTVNLNGELVGIGKTIISSEFDVDGTITTTGLRLRNGAVKDYVLTSDGSGRGSWQPRILEVIGGSGLTGSGTSGTVSVAVDFSVVASVSYVDLGTSSLWSAINSLGATNGLSEISSGVIGLGGTLSQTTTIDLSVYDFTLNTNSSEIELNRVSTSYPGVTNTFLLEDKYAIIRSKSSSYNSSISLGNEDNGQMSIVMRAESLIYSNSHQVSNAYIHSVVLSTDGSGSASGVMLYNSSQSLTSGDVSINNNLIIIDQLSSKGLVYDEDYSPNFSDNSLVTKSWVNSNTTGKYSVTRGFTASIVETITHNLGTDEIIVQCYDSSGTMVIPGTVQINGANDVDITFSSNLSNVKTVIIG